MSGTQDMIARILADAEAEGARIEEQARNKAGALLQEAGEQAEESKRRAAEEAAKQAEDIVRSARSAAISCWKTAGADRGRPGRHGPGACGFAG